MTGMFSKFATFIPKNRTKPMTTVSKVEHRMHSMSKNGDDTMVWNPDDIESVRKAREKFNEYKRAGAEIFETHTVSDDGVLVERKSSRRANTFDPMAGRYVVVPRPQGG